MAYANAQMANAIPFPQSTTQGSPVSGFSEAFTDLLLDKLSSDDIFRLKFIADPRSALHSLGHETNGADVGIEGRDAAMAFLHFKGGLASKEKIAQGREQLKAMLRERSALGGANGLAFGPFDICSG